MATQGVMAPTSAVRLANGHTLITEPFVDQLVEIDGTPQQRAVYIHGGLGVAGNGTNELNQAYDARVVGDFTGLTAPRCKEGTGRMPRATSSVPVNRAHADRAFASRAP